MSLSSFGIQGQFFLDGKYRQAILIINKLSGQIESLCTQCDALSLASDGMPIVDYGDARILPGDINTHSHPEQSVYVETVDPSWELATWCRNTIYKYSTQMTPELIYLACARAFSRMLCYGTTTVFVSYYCHNRQGNNLDRSVIKAALDTGIRLYYGRMNYDIILESAYQEKKESQRSYFEPIQEAEQLFLELLNEFDDQRFKTVTIAPAIHSFHANTLKAIIRGIQLGEQTNRLVQFHLSEDQGDVDLCLKEFGKRPVEVLHQLYREKRISKLDHLFVSDAIWLDEREKDLLAELGIKIVLNPRMNDRVKAGRADLLGYLQRNIPVWVGTDGEASNEDLSLTHEKAYLKKINPVVTNSLFDTVAQKSLPIANFPVGHFTPGAAADLKVLKNGSVEAVYVGGKMVVDNGELTTLNICNDIESPLSEIQKQLGLR